MAKRSRAEDDGASGRPSKRSKSFTLDRLSNLSDELLVLLLSYLPISQLVVCQRLSSRFRKLAGDGQLWKAHYHSRFVRPRASRLPGLKEVGVVHDSLNFASKSSRWLDDEHLVARGGQTDWKMQYKLRHNWSRGLCETNEIPIAEQTAIPPVLVEMTDGIVFTADQSDGLRAFSAKAPRQMVAQLPFPSSRMPRPPTALSIDATAKSGEFKIVVGFEDGSFSVYQLLQELEQSEHQFVHQYTHESSSNGVISASAVAWPYVATMTATQLLSVYRFREIVPAQDILDPPRLLHSLKSHTVWPPLCVTLRASPSTVLTSIAYALPTYLSGWTVGIQEIKLSPDGRLISSRIASAIDQHYRPLAFSSRPIMQHLAPFASTSASPPLALELKHIHSKPTSLSYTHPYLLVSHPDNTLTLYLVTSTTDSLSISSGSRLWGHTSAVSGASVGRRGKAVSVSRRGDELRVWELEGGFGSSAARKRLASGDLSVEVKPGLRSRQTGKSGQPAGEIATDDIEADDVGDGQELTQTRGWVGFNDENVCLLKESPGKQTLVVYDFT